MGLSMKIEHLIKFKSITEDGDVHLTIDITRRVFNDAFIAELNSYAMRWDRYLKDWSVSFQPMSDNEGRMILTAVLGEIVGHWEILPEWVREN